MMNFIKTLFMYGTSYTYANLSRLFIRLFVGIMLLQFGIRQISSFDLASDIFPSLFGMASQTTLVIMITIEIVCAVMIMIGLLTRISILPILISLIIAADKILSTVHYDIPSDFSMTQPIYVPIMFIGIFIYILLAGPGKISLDYLISLHLINKNREFDDDDKLQSA